MKTADLSKFYEEHNLRRGRGFVFGGQERVQHLKDLIGQQSFERVLDVGCRDGTLMGRLEIASLMWVGCDIDLTALNFSRKHGILPVAVHLGQALPFVSSSFDLVVAGEILEHLAFPEVLVKEMARVATKGGLVVGSVPNSYRLKNRILFLFGKEFETDPSHLRQFSVQGLRRCLQNGFSEVEIVPCVGRISGFMPHLTSNDLVWRASH